MYAMLFASLQLIIAAYGSQRKARKCLVRVMGMGILQSDLVAGQLTAVLFLRLREWPSRGQVHIAQRRRGADKARLGTTHLEADAQGPSLHLSDLKSARFRQCPYINMPPLLLCARCISCRWIKNDELSKFGKLITAHNGENHLI